MAWSNSHKEIERQIKIEFDCEFDNARDDIREAYLRGWLDAEQLSGRKANPDQFSSLVCECGHRKEHHVPNKIRQDAGYMVCWISGCKCNKEW